MEESKNFLKDYCKWMEQKINMSKSMILYGKSVSSVRRRKINYLLGFRKLEEITYLGVKLATRRLKSLDFQHVKRKTMEKINTWGSRSLSLAGRIVLVKSTLFSISTFFMSHSLIPRGILCDIDKICRNFFYGIRIMVDRVCILFLGGGCARLQS
ncbi:hypothetical protein KFK09_000651 [Dendrobium nobile]|uniref:Uncharacterized protein n=1 Tax=Dendrobium nobile TaxID=94219 RepID=A0A8T3CEI6_DENNO|nr:hypothetical protein KFK09_000651 [Dendrobium nobile]